MNEMAQLMHNQLEALARRKDAEITKLLEDNLTLRQQLHKLEIRNRLDRQNQQKLIKQVQDLNRKIDVLHQARQLPPKSPSFQITPPHPPSHVSPSVSFQPGLPDPRLPILEERLSEQTNILSKTQHQLNEMSLAYDLARAESESMKKQLSDQKGKLSHLEEILQIGQKTMNDLNITKEKLGSDLAQKEAIIARLKNLVEQLTAIKKESPILQKVEHIIDRVYIEKPVEKIVVVEVPIEKKVFVEPRQAIIQKAATQCYCPKPTICKFQDSEKEELKKMDYKTIIEDYNDRIAKFEAERRKLINVIEYDRAEARRNELAAKLQARYPRKGPVNVNVETYRF